jgi:hypothetical protein
LRIHAEVKTVFWALFVLSFRTSLLANGRDRARCPESYHVLMSIICLVVPLLEPQTAASGVQHISI